MPRRPFDTHVSHIADWLAENGRRLPPDREHTRSFLGLLDPEAEFFSYRTFSESAYTRLPGRDPLEQGLHGGLDECWEELTELNRRGACVCVTVNATNGQGRSVEDIVRIRALVADDDYPGRRPEHLGIRPDISVESSPGRYHHYWLVHQMAKGDFVVQQRQLAHALSADTKICALNFPMALPGFWRRKPGRPPVMTRVLGQVMEL